MINCGIGHKSDAFFMTEKDNAIGIFDSGFGGLTVLKSIIAKLPQYDYVYFGDNARSPYGDLCYETVYRYTLQAVSWLFGSGCRLVILACNTASARVLKNIQQLNLSKNYPHHRVLGVIRPTAEIIGNYTQTKHVGVLGTHGTVKSNSYKIEINNFYPDIKVHQQSCPLFVPMIEKGEHESDDIDFYIDQYLSKLKKKSTEIDCILLACTHYPLLIPKFLKHLNPKIKLLSQGKIVADSLADYLERHQEINCNLKQTQKRNYFTTGNPAVFDQQGSIFLGSEIKSIHVSLV